MGAAFGELEQLSAPGAGQPAPSEPARAHRGGHAGRGQRGRREVALVVRIPPGGCALSELGFELGDVPVGEPVVRWVPDPS